MVHLSCIQNHRRCGLSKCEDVVMVKACPSMDLLVIGNGIEWTCVRTFSWQSIHTTSSENAMIDMAWSPDGTVLCTLSQQKTLTLFDFESNDQKNETILTLPTTPTTSTSSIVTRSMMAKQKHSLNTNHHRDGILAWLKVPAKALRKNDFTMLSPMVSSSNRIEEEATVLVIVQNSVVYLYWNGTFCIYVQKLPSSTTVTNITHVVAYHSSILLLSSSSQTTTKSCFQIFLPPKSIQPNLKLWNQLSWMIPQFQIWYEQTANKIISNFQSQFKSCLQPLEQKWMQLYKLYQSYGHTTTSINPAVFLQKELKTFILSKSSCNNVMDQFWTHPLMNPQLLSRTQTTMETSLQQLESSLKSSLLTPLEQWTLHVESISTNIELTRAFEITLLIVQEVLTQFVQLRTVIPQIWTWMKGTVSQVKARGTAPDSIQRKLAKERRIPTTLLHSLLKRFSSTTTTNSIENDTMTWTEVLLDISVSSYFTSNSTLTSDIPTMQECLSTIKTLWNQHIVLQPRQQIQISNSITCQSLSSSLQLSLTNMKDVIVETTSQIDDDENNELTILHHDKDLDMEEEHIYITTHNYQDLQLHDDFVTSPKLRLNGTLQQAKFYKSDSILLLLCNNNTNDTETKEYQLWLVPINQLPMTIEKNNEDAPFYSMIVASNDDDNDTEDDEVSVDQHVVRCKSVFILYILHMHINSFEIYSCFISYI